MNSFSTFGSNIFRGDDGTLYYKKYIIKVVTSVFSVDSVKQKDLTADIIPGKTYKFDQSESSNLGYPFVFGVTPDGANITTAGITYTSYGTPGNPGAFTKLVVANTGFVAGVLYYYSASSPYMGYGPPTITVNNSNVSLSSSFIFTIINRTNATLGYSISGQNTYWPLTAGQLDLTSLTSTTVASGLTTIYCTNKSSVYQTITCTLTNVTPTTAVTAVMQGPAASLQVSTASSVPYGSSFTFTINNTSGTIIAYILESTLTTLLYTDLSFSNAAAINTNVSVAAGVVSTITCWNKTSAAKTVVLSSSGLASVQAVLNAEILPTITFNPATLAIYEQSFTVTINNLSAVSVHAAISTGGSEADTLSDLSLNSASISIIYAGNAGVFRCVNKSTSDKTVTCTATGTGLTTVTNTLAVKGQFTPVLSLGSTNTGYGTSNYSTDSTTGALTFDGSGYGYVMYGTSTDTSTLNCLDISKNSFKLVFEVTHQQLLLSGSTTVSLSQHCWATTPNGSVGLLYFFSNGNVPSVICYSTNTGNVEFKGTAMTFNSINSVNQTLKATFTLMRLGTNLSCTMLYNGITTKMTATAPSGGNFTYSNGVVTANSLAYNQNLGIFPLRLGGYSNNSAGRKYADGNVDPGGQHFKGTIHKFDYYSVA